MRVLIAPDKFKGTLSSSEAASAIADGVKSASGNDVEILQRPLADGGEGSHTTLLALDPDFSERSMTVSSLYKEKIFAKYLVHPDGSAFLEAAHIIGLELSGARERNPMQRSTGGVGEWIEYISRTATSIGLFLGGSATVDGGFGMARTLGFEFLDSENRVLNSFNDLDTLDRIHLPRIHIPLITVYTDVNSPLTGSHGSARVFAAQKGADANEIERIEMRLQRMVSAYSKSGIDVNIPGSGAAGGLAVPLIALQKNEIRIKSGIEFFLQRAGIEKLLISNPPDLIISGEGCTDKSTLSGKVVMGLFELAKKNHTRFGVVSGMVRDLQELTSAGISLITSTVDVCGPVPENLTPDVARTRLVKSANHLMKLAR